MQVKLCFLRCARHCATLCGDCACRTCGMQVLVKLRFLRPCPSGGIVRVEGAECWPSFLGHDCMWRGAEACRRHRGMICECERAPIYVLAVLLVGRAGACVIVFLRRCSLGVCKLFAGQHEQIYVLAVPLVGCADTCVIVFLCRCSMHGRLQVAGCWKVSARARIYARAVPLAGRAGAIVLVSLLHVRMHAFCGSRRCSMDVCNAVGS